MTSLSPASARLWLPSLFAASALSASGAPQLRVERNDGSEISRKPCVIGWKSISANTGLIDTIEIGSADLVRLTSGKVLGLVYSDGSASSWMPFSAPVPVPAENIKSLVLSLSLRSVLKTDGSVQYWFSGQLPPPPADLGTVSELAGGPDHLVALRENGTVAAWGVANMTNSSKAMVPAGLSGVVGIAASDEHSVALKSDGTVVVWGWNQLRNIPAGLSQVKQIVAYPQGTMALKNDGSIRVWGYSVSGQTPPAGLGAVTQISADGTSAAGIRPDGTVAVWGNSGLRVTPPGLGEVTAIASADGDVAAMTPRRIESFGNQGKGIPAERTFTIRNTGDEALDLGGIALAPLQGNAFTLNTTGMPASLPPGQSCSFKITFTPSALTPEGSLLTLSSNDSNHPSFRFAVSGKGVNQAPVAADHTASVEEDTTGADIVLPAFDPNGDQIILSISNPSSGGKVTALSGNSVRFIPDKDFTGTFTFKYQVNDGTLYSETRMVTLTMVPVNDPPFIVLPPDLVVRATAAGAGSPAPLKVSAGDVEDGKLIPVMKVNGQLIGPDHVFPPGVTQVDVTVTDSNGIITTRSFQVTVVEGPSLGVQLSGRPIQRSGQVLAWGQAGLGTIVPAGLIDATAVAGGYNHSIALREDGQVVAWGDNEFGQGVVPSDLADVVAIAAGAGFNLALRADGTVRSWGSEGFGYVVPSGLSDVVSIAAGSNLALALKSDGTVVAWGGGGPVTNVPAGLSEVESIFAGTGVGYAVKKDGSIIAWGRPDEGQLEVPSWLTGVESISSKNYHAIAKRFDGSLVAWGNNSYDLAQVPSNLSGVFSVSAGSIFNIAARGDGSVFHWGGYVHALDPPPIPFGIDIVTAGDSHALGIQNRAEQLSFRTPVAFAPVLRSLELTNTGSSDLQITGLSIGGAHPLDFTLASGGIPSSLPPGASAQFGVTFLPMALGQRQATLSIQTNDPLASTRNIKLNGLWTNKVPVASAVTGLVLNEDTPGGLEITLPATDGNGQDLAYSIITPPAAAAGTLGPGIGNKVVFTPTLDFNGSASFTFRVSDGFNQSNVAPVSLTVNAVEDHPRLNLPQSPLVVPVLETGGSVVEFLVGGRDPEDGWVDVLVTRDGVPVSSGDFFPLGETVVQVTATDSGGRTTTESFVVRVVAGSDMVLEADGTPLSRVSGVVSWGVNSPQLTPPSGLASVTRLAAGYAHSLALKTDGTVVAWGSNGGGSTTVPAGLSGVVEIAAGLTHSVALKTDGTVLVWGSSNYGVQPPADLPPMKAIASGLHHIVALSQEGRVIAWGRNSSGECNVPAGLDDVIAVAAGSGHSAAVKQDGTVVAWGASNYGQATVPAGLSTVKSVRCGAEHTLALRKDGTLVAWGRNNLGQAIIPPGLAGVKEIATGTYHNIALKFDGSLIIWGWNSSSQGIVPANLGKVRLVAASEEHTLAFTEQASPVGFNFVNRALPLIKTFTIRNQGQGALEIEDFELTGADAAFFQVQEGGMDEHLETGESATFTVTFAPGHNGPHAANLRLITNDTTRPNWDLALTGHGFNGSPVTPPVTGITTAEDTPVGITLPATDPEGDALSFELTSLTPANAGTFSAVVNRAFTFTPKANFNGAVSFTYRASDGGTTSEGTVSLVVTPVNDPPVFSYLPDLIRVFTPDEAGAAVNFRMPVISDVEDGSITPVLTVNGQTVSNTSIFPTTTPSMVAKGTDSAGATVEGGILLSVVRTIGASARLENPDGAGLPRSPAVLEWNSLGLVSGTVPPDLRGVKQISAGDDHAIALRNDGTLFGWGAATQSRLSIPPDLTNVTKVVCGPNHTLALRSTGTVVAWGNNTNGQSTVPAGLSGITGIATGELFSLALRSNGTVAVWGQTFGGSWSPPANLTGVTAITVGRSHALALKSDGTVVAWGSNEYNKTTIPAGLSGVIAIAAGNDHSVALKSDGTVVVWGGTLYRQGPVPAGLTGVTSISAGPYHTMALKSDGSVVAWGSYQPNVRIQSLPPSVKNVTATDGGNGRLFAVVDNPYSLDFGKVGTDRTVTRTVTIRNRGTAPLSITGVERLSGSTSFTHSTVGMSSIVATGGSTTFSIAFAPSSLGTETARFRVTSNDRYEPTMDVEVSAEGVSPFSAWALAAGLTGGDASSDAEPFDDGLINLVKYAFNMNGAGPDRGILVPGTGTSGLPHISVEGSGDHSILRVEYLRRRSGLVQYEVQTTSDLAEEFAGVSILPDVLPIDEDWERVIVRMPFDPAVDPIGFARVRVTF